MKKCAILLLLFPVWAIGSWADDSLNVRTVGSWPYYYAYSVATCSLDGHKYAILGLGGGLFILNIDIPSSPIKIGEAPIGGKEVYQANSGGDIIANGNFVYLALFDEGIGIVDISDPIHPVICSKTPVLGRITNVVVSGNTLFAVDDSFGLRIFDITDKYMPTELQMIPMEAGCSGAAVTDTILFVNKISLIGDAWLFSYNISNPTNPVKIDSINEWIVRFVLQDNKLYGLGLGGITTIDVNRPDSMFLIGAGGLSSYKTIDVQDTLLLGVNYYGYGGVDIYSVSDPANPTLLSTYDSQGYSRDVTGLGHYMLVAEDFWGMGIVDITNPSAPSTIGHFSAPYAYTSPYIQDTRLYLASGNVQLIDISDTGQPKGRGCFYDKNDNSFWDVAVKDSFAFATSVYGGVWSIDFSNRDFPILADSLYYYQPKDQGNKLVFAGSLDIKDTFAYVSVYPTEIKIINISDPYNIHVYSSYPLFGHLVINGDYAYVATADSGLRILNIADPGTLRKSATIP